MKLSDFDYHLPSELIAQFPSPERDASRLMVVDRSSRTIQHGRFRDLPRFVSPQDLFVLNDSRVIPARLYGQRPGREEQIEVLLLRRMKDDVWQTLVRPGKKARAGTRILFRAGELEAQVVESMDSAVRHLSFDCRRDFWDLLQEVGQMPLPPYIDRQPCAEDRKRYQTIFARSPGSVAAPTAGLHFTAELLARLPHCKITLHVGYATFKPVLVQEIEQHQMEAEYYEVSTATARRITERMRKGGRLIAVGTTTTRTLEHIQSKRGAIAADRGWTDLFIYPGFKFRVIGGLLTNFHLPKSTLLMLVSAFGGKDLIDRCYREAIQERYRFYSYGDAMLIL